MRLPLLHFLTWSFCRLVALRHDVSANDIISFHTNIRPLGFLLSLISRVTQVFNPHNYSNKEENFDVNNDRVIEIMKLGISSKIIDALAKKGITKLFPIQRVEFLGIYGLIIDVIIGTNINVKAKSYYLFDGYAYLPSIIG
ncbi:hypothetical protein VNO78_08134 [Psophocarpus tetragonolobus]|uniref:Uncharacterized protein n=1 Tax=Psophocarpus tetragonolobus TaxID=3891 RepID=A0AAN9XSB9_PSOTE